MNSWTMMGRISLFVALCGIVSGHVFLYDPPQRSSIWRHRGMNKTGLVVRNNDDMGLNCGGMWIQHERNGGRCGVCGDAYDASPRPHYAHQYPGRYARGVLAGCYLAGARTMQAEVWVTAHHEGYFEFRLCANNDYSHPVSQACLDEHLLTIETTQGQNMGTQYYPDTAVDDGIFRIELVLPPGLVCTQCVLQFKYTAGNSWGCGPEGKCGVGMGKQEEFWNCADVAILPQCDGVVGSVAVTLEPESRDTLPDEAVSGHDHSPDFPNSVTGGMEEQTRDHHVNVISTNDDGGKWIQSPDERDRLVAELDDLLGDRETHVRVNQNIQHTGDDERVNSVVNNDSRIDNTIWKADSTHGQDFVVGLGEVDEDTDEAAPAVIVNTGHGAQVFRNGRPVANMNHITRQTTILGHQQQRQQQIHGNPQIHTTNIGNHHQQHSAPVHNPRQNMISVNQHQNTAPVNHQQRNMVSINPQQETTFPRPGNAGPNSRRLPHLPNSRVLVDIPVDINGPRDCIGAGPWAGDFNMDQWCSVNCARGFCPANTCICDY